jgi:Asp-tRNA(Asn)/Glu-tRNA(Gln) amidotransferase A subunit family amidase
MDLLDLPAHALSDAIRARQVSCRELMRATLARIEALNPAYTAIVSLRDGDDLLREADERDAQLQRAATPAGPIGWMHGLPQAIKDLALTAGLRTTLGSPLLKDFVPRQDGLMVQRMKAAGCIVIGKTNTSEFGLGSHTFNEVFGTTRNAWDPTRSAGGSSGGAAVALALRMLPVADGSDFMGSLRNPAAWNNVFGLRPSQGRRCSTSRPATTSARRSRWRAASGSRTASMPSRARTCASAGWATSRATCPWSPASSTFAGRGCAASRPWAARSSPWRTASRPRPSGRPG